MGNITVVPPPLVLEPSGSWYGNDGSWSSFTIRVGTPPQNFSVLPATNGQNTWVPIADDCKALNITNCGQLRGVLPFNNAQSPGFQINSSTTWELIGLYQLGQDSFLGFTGNGLSGYDTVGFLTDNVSSSFEIKRQAVTAYATPTFWLGQIGLSRRGMNFKQSERPESFLTNMRDEGFIPSLSFGYTAGASHRSTKVPGSLTLGGYDSSRMSKVLTVTLNEDEDRPLTVGLQSIVVTNSLSGSIALSDTGVLAPIDSSVPELWLPRSICDKFESAFGLEYHDVSGRYILSDENHDKLRQLSPVLTFTIGTERVEGQTITIQLPYSAFDHQASYPIFAKATNYFPLRRAANDSQYMIGRTFLQETYISVDYERKSFNISQAMFTTPMPAPNIVTILPLITTNSTNGSPIASKEANNHLSGGAIAGIAIGVVAAIAFIVGLVWWVLKRLAARKGSKEGLVEPTDTETVDRLSNPQKPEIMGEEIGEMEANHGRSEVEDMKGEVAEVEGTPAIYELR